MTWPLDRRGWSAIPVLTCWLVLATVCQTRAHDIYTAFIQHGVQLSVGKDRLDVTVDLTFFEEWSLRERTRMDTDSNGRLDKQETAAYLKRLGAEIAGNVLLRVEGRPVPLEPLYEPELDLLGNHQAKPGHHRLTLHLFAPEPPTLTAGSVLILEDRLWPDARSLTTLHLKTEDGYELEARGKPGSAKTASGGESALAFAVVCRKAPAPQATQVGSLANTPATQSQTRSNVSRAGN